MAPLPLRLAGKKALVTGAARGLGEAIARGLARHGATVFLTDIDEPTVRAVAAAIEAEHGAGTAFAAPHDVRDEARWQAVIDEAVAAMGGLSVLVNNAGIGAQGRVEEVGLDDWHNMMAINVDSVFLGCKHALRHLRDNQPASIVNISSIAAIVADGQYAAYNTSKAAVMMLTKSVALDCARAGVDVRCQFGASRLHPHRHHRALLRAARRGGGDAQAGEVDPDEAAGAARRRRPCRGLPGVGREPLRHRQ